MKSLKEFIENTDKRLAIIEEYLINDFKKKNKFNIEEMKEQNLNISLGLEINKKMLKETLELINKKIKEESIKDIFLKR